MKAGSSNVADADATATARVTARYSSLKRQTPSAGGSGAAIASIRAATASIGSASGLGACMAAMLRR
jgi:hypothetical protein